MEHDSLMCIELGNAAVRNPREKNKRQDRQQHCSGTWLIPLIGLTNPRRLRMPRGIAAPGMATVLLTRVP